MHKFLTLLDEAPAVVTLSIKWGNGGFEITIVAPKGYTEADGTTTLTRTVWPQRKIDDAIESMSEELLNQLHATS